MGFLSDFRTAPTPDWGAARDPAPYHEETEVVTGDPFAAGSFLPGPTGPSGTGWSQPSGGGWTEPPAGGWSEPPGHGWSQAPGLDVFAFASNTAPRRPRRSRLVAVVVVVAALALVGGGSAVLFRSSGPSLHGVAPDQVLADTLTAARKAQTVHGDVTQVQDGDVTHLTFDISSVGGVETMTDSGHTVKFIGVDGFVYLQGDRGALSQLLGLPDAVAAQYAGQWVSFPADSGPMKQVAQELRTPVVIDDLLSLSGAMVSTAAAAPGDVSIRGTVPSNSFNDGSGAGDTATLSVSSKSPFLPVSLSYSDPQNGSTLVNFSNWGERVTAQAPANATPLDVALNTLGGAPA